MMLHSEEYVWGGSDDLPWREGDASIWSRSTMTCLYFDKKLNSKNACTDYPCRVTFRPGEIEIMYVEDYEASENSTYAPRAVYRGADEGDGHFYR
jgi:hypothetical protein